MSFERRTFGAECKSRKPARAWGLHLDPGTKERDMPDVKRTESMEPRRSRRPSSYAPQQSSDALQKDPSPSALPDDGTRFERVRQRAYELYVKRGSSQGDEVADWLEAERQIDSERPR
jgi:hypothetical protein